MHKPFIFLIQLLLLTGTLPMEAQSIKSLFTALEKDDTSLLKNLLQSGVDVNAADADSDNVLMYAALYASPTAMKILLDHKANPNQSNKLGETPLMWSTHDLQKVKLLVAFGADISAKSAGGNTVLLIAAKGYNRLPIVQWLADHGADCRAVNNAGENALMRAAEYGDTTLLQFLYDKGIALTTKDHDSSHVLLSAAENPTALRWLVDKMQTTNATDSMMAEVLTYAVVEDEVDVVKALVKKIKNINWSDRDGYSPLMWAVFNEHVHTDMVKMLIDAGANLQHVAKDGTNALHWARKKGNTAVVQLLIQYGAK